MAKRHYNTSKNGRRFSFTVPDGFIMDNNQWLNYGVTHWMIDERCKICSRKKRCATLKMVCQGMGEDYPVFPAMWLIIQPDYMMLYEERRFLPSRLILCSGFKNVQTTFLRGDQQRMLRLMLQTAREGAEAEREEYREIVNNLEIHTLQNV